MNIKTLQLIGTKILVSGTKTVALGAGVKVITAACTGGLKEVKILTVIDLLK